MAKLLILYVYFCLNFVKYASGHGRLWEPPARSTLWRRGYLTIHNYDDNALFCGGFSVQMMNGGKCGICGDPYNAPQPRDHEAGGKYASGIITRHYAEGQLIDVDVDITANHKGWFEFRLCPNNDVKKIATQACFDNNLLKFANNSTRLHISTTVGRHHAQVQLPPGLTCTQCILQWKYHTGNSWGVDPSGRGCIGCGPQEEFYGCSDIAIESKSGKNQVNSVTKAKTTTTKKPITTTKRPTTTSTTTTTTTTTPTTTVKVTTPTTTKTTTTTKAPTTTTAKPSTTTTRAPTTTTTTTQKLTTTTKPTSPSSTTAASNGSGARPVPGGMSRKKKCGPTYVWKKTPGMQQWCETNCRMGYCPASHCVCV